MTDGGHVALAWTLTPFYYTAR